MLKKTHHFSHMVQYCSIVFPVCLKRSVLPPVSLRTPLFQIPNLLGLAILHMPEPALLKTTEQLC